MTKKFDIETRKQFQLNDYSEKRNQDFQRFKAYADRVWKEDYANALKELK